MILGVYWHAQLPMDHHDPNFVWFADYYSRLQSWFEPISADEWDLIFFARPIPKTGEQYHEAVARALDQLDSPVELRSVSKYRLAWMDIEFWQDDVIRGWAAAGDVARLLAGKIQGISWEFPFQRRVRS
jgi:hypothetical protein